MLIDLHTHSNASDGTDSPSALIHKALIRGIDVLALTDHDTTAGWSEAINALHGSQINRSMELVLGAEVSCQDENGISIHILGLLFDPTYQPLIDEFAKTRENRLTRMERIVARLNEAELISLSKKFTPKNVMMRRWDDPILLMLWWHEGM